MNLTENIGEFVGSKYIDTIGLSYLELTNLMSEDLDEAVKEGILLEGNYYISASKTPAGHSIKVKGMVVIVPEEDEKIEYTKKVIDIIGKYNYFKGKNSCNEKARRFYNEDVSFYELDLSLL